MEISKKILAKIDELKSIEMALGHLPPEEHLIRELHKKLHDPSYNFKANQLEQKSELLFGEICDELHELGLPANEISNILNSQLKYPGSPPYTNEQEINDIIREG